MTVLLQDEVKAHKWCCISCLLSSICISITVAELLILRFCDISSISVAEVSRKITIFNDVTRVVWHLEQVFRRTCRLCLHVENAWKIWALNISPWRWSSSTIETLTPIHQSTCRYHQENRNFDQRLLLKRVTHENAFPAFLNFICDVTAEVELQWWHVTACRALTELTYFSSVYKWLILQDIP